MSTAPTGVQQAIESELARALDPAHLEVVNESHLHNVPPGSESHFKVVVVSDAFAEQALVARHRTIYGLLARQLEGGVHALALHTYTAREWRERHPDSPVSPPCLGGERAAPGSR